MTAVIWRARMVRVVGVAATVGLLGAGLVAPAQAAAPDQSERAGWSLAERREYGRDLADRAGADPVAATVGPVVGGDVAVLDAASSASAAGDLGGGAGGAPVLEPGSATVDVPGAGAGTGKGRAGGLPVTAKAAAGPGRQVRIQVHDAKAAKAAGVNGILLTVTGQSKHGGDVELALDRGALAAAGSSEWATRARLVQLPACVLTTPEVPACRTRTEVKHAGDEALSGVVDVPATGTQARTSGLSAAAAPVVLAAEAGTSGPTGSWSATPLTAAASWDVSLQTGSFSWSYPMRTPPVPGSLAPQVGLSYNSGSLDGRTVSQNSQSSAVGDGFDLTGGGFIERSYVPCDDDKETTAGTPNNASLTRGDMCWGTDNLNLVLGGRSTSLVKGADGSWHPDSDDGTRVERLNLPSDANGGWGNGDNDREYYKATTPDGTQYWFGRDKRSATDTSPQYSSWTVRVYGNHPGEPCYNASFAASGCDQAWRWNLDYVVDPSGNSMSYWYGREWNAYGHDAGAGKTSYVAGGVLNRIEYGTRAGSETTAKAPAVVTFSYAERCTAAAADCEAGDLTAATRNSWPDVPFDLVCSTDAAVTTCPVTSPSFFTRLRYTAVATNVLGSDGATYRDVDQWTLAQSYSNTGESRIMRLDQVQHKGLAASQNVVLPATVLGYTQYANRVDVVADARPSMIRDRLTSIRSEAGGVTGVTYTASDCAAKPASPETNTKRCIPVWWDPAGSTPMTMEYFNKYAVASVSQSPEDGISKTVRTSYTYTGAAWHYNDDELTPAKYRTWSDWRGYAQVDVATGDQDLAGQAQQRTRYRYFQGMDGDRASAAGGTRTVSVDGIADLDEYAGTVREEITYNGAPAPATEVSGTLTWPWRSAATATDSLGSAYRTGVAKTETRTRLAAGVDRTTRVETEYDAYGMPILVKDHGDVTVATDDRCTTTTYARNTAANILEPVATELTVGKGCGQTVAYPADVISHQQYAYDNLAVGAAPTKGLVTRTDEAGSYTGVTPAWVTTASTAYDKFGRVTSVKDALNRETKTAYTDTAGLTTSTTVTTPDPDGATTTLSSHVTTTTVDPAWGTPVSVKDANGKVTTAQVDALGRLAKVWLPGRATSATPNSEYAYTLGATAGVANGKNAVVTKSLTHDGRQLTAVTLYDGLLRQRQTQTPSVDRVSPGVLVANTYYDSRGLAYEQQDPWFTNVKTSPDTAMVSPQDTIPGATITEYDGAGRATASIYKVSGIEKWRTTTTYSGDEVTVTPPAGGTKTTTITDARGQSTALRQFTTASAYQTTTYRYDVAGRLAGMSDAAGNTWSYTHDLRGRQTSASDPDKGTTTTTYDDAGQVLTTSDARGETLAYDYDQLGRKTSVHDDTTMGAVRARWTYDTLAKGQLTASERLDTTGTYATAVTGFDDGYRPLGQTVTLPGGAGAGLAGTYTTTYTYTLDGRLKTATHPAVGTLNAETVTTVYDAANQAEWMTGGNDGDLYVANAEYNPFGQVELLDMGGWYPVQDIRSYETGTHRLANQRVLTDGSEDANATYAYDHAGNVTAVKNTPANATADRQCFTYDALRRLTQAWTPTSGDCAATPTTVGLGGAAKYWHTYAYDAVGNRTSVVAHTGADTAASNTTSTYTYPTAGAEAVAPHAVTTVNKAGASTGTASFTYDLAGNMTGRALPGAASQTLTWDAEGELTRVAQDGNGDGDTTDANETDTYVYDADGNRLLRKQDGKTTAYLPGGTELTLTGTTVTGARYYTFAGSTVAVRSSAGTAGTTTIVADHHNTAHLQVKQTDGTRTRNYTDPFGARRGTAATLAGDHGFLDKPTDTTGLTAIGARYYDPMIGKFISVDPIMDLKDPQQWAPYGYSNNNPLTWTDPTGLIVNGPMIEDNGTAYGSTRAYSSAKVSRTATQMAKAAYRAMQSWRRSSPWKSILKTGNSYPRTLNRVIPRAVEAKSKQAEGDIGGAFESMRGACGPGSISRCHAAMDATFKLASNFKSGGNWDMKVSLREDYSSHLTNVGRGPEFGLGGGRRMNYDVFGNVQFGYMMARANVTQENALVASHGTPEIAGASDANGGDDVSVSLGYQMEREYGANLSESEFVAFIYRQSTIDQLVAVEKVVDE